MRSIASRVGWGVATLFGASVLAFLLMRVLPGDPARLAAGELASEDAVRARAVEMGLDQPLPLQYLRFIRDFVTGDWGYAYSIGTPAREAILGRLPATVELAILAFVIGVSVGVSLALLAAYTRRRWVDVVIRGLSSLGMATPQFYMALILLLVLSQGLGLFPGPEGRLTPGLAEPPHRTGMFTVDAMLAGQWATASDAFAHLILPAVVLAMVPAAFLLRLLRSNLLETSREQYMLVLRAKGTPRGRSYVRHAFPNAALPTITASGLLLAELLAGSILAEKVFGWPGVGSLVADSVLSKDFAIVQSFVFLSALIYVVVNTLIDVVYGLVDPRIRSASR